MLEKQEKSHRKVLLNIYNKTANDKFNMIDFKSDILEEIKRSHKYD